MTASILDDAETKIAQFNDEGLHYNLAADQIYKKRFAVGTDPFDKSFLPYVIAGLISFDMGRMMGSEKYAFNGDRFASRLSSKLHQIRPLLEPLMNLSLLQIDLNKHRDAITRSYETLSARGSGALHDQTKSFHVGATKILHFLNPQLFIIVDSNAARAFRIYCNLPFRSGTQPGFSANRYWECMRQAQIDISAYGLRRFQALEPQVPLTRIYDKLTFIAGSRY